MRVGATRLRALWAAAPAVTLIIVNPAWATTTMPKPVVTSIKAFPATVASGGTTGIEASLSGAGMCVLTAPKSKPVSGLTTEGFPCGGGNVTVTHVVTMPSNRGSKPTEYTLTFTAHAPTGKGKVKAKIKVVVLPEATQLADKQLIALGYATTCAVLAQGERRGHVFCWGLNARGDLGVEKSKVLDATAPVEVEDVEHAVELAAGAEHTCALLANGHIKCWGAAIGLGNGADVGIEGSATPVAVANIASAVQIAAGNTDTCALLTTGEVKCWGLDTFVGQLGVETVDPLEKFSPIPLPAVTHAVELTAGREDTCARRDDGSVGCWGGNAYGEMGDKATGRERFAPYEIKGVKGAIQLSSGESHNCAVVNEASRPVGQVLCWGRDSFGQLGNDSLGPAFEAGDVVDGQQQAISGAAQVSAAEEHTCDLLKGGKVDCWGADTVGQLGDGKPNEKEKETVPVAVHDGTGDLEHVVELNASYKHTCALLEDGAIKCWGSDRNHELGGGEAPYSAVPVTVAGFPPLAAAAHRETARHKAHRRHRRRDKHR